MIGQAAEASRIVERDFTAAWWLLAEAGGHELHDDPDLRWFHTGVNDAYLNPVLETRLDGDEADAAIDRMLGELRRREAPFLWWVTPNSRPRDLGDRLERRGLAAGDAWPGMTLRIDALVEPATVPGLVIRRVANDAELDKYVEIFAPILSTSPAFAPVFADAARRIGYEDGALETHFVGDLDGEPLATASLLTAGGAAGIYNVTTMEHARGRGIGAAMTAAAVRAGGARGLRTATLQASPVGRTIYERLGFRFVCDLVPYRSPHES